MHSCHVLLYSSLNTGWCRGWEKNIYMYHNKYDSAISKIAPKKYASSVWKKKGESKKHKKLK
jgi:hypothetical protein